MRPAKTAARNRKHDRCIDITTTASQKQLGAGGGGRGWGLGEMELRVGSNIIIHFLDIIVASHVAHVLVRYTLLAVTVICITFVKLRKCWRML